MGGEAIPPTVGTATSRAAGAVLSFRDGSHPAPRFLFPAAWPPRPGSDGRADGHRDLVLRFLPPSVPAPPVDAARVALRLEFATRVVRPARILFSWSLSDRDARFQGRGVARVEPPFKARLDLFYGNGETIARAALVDDDLRIPLGTPGRDHPACGATVGNARGLPSGARDHSPRRGKPGGGSGPPSLPAARRAGRALHREG